MKSLREWWEKIKRSSSLSNGSQRRRWRKRRDEIVTQPNWNELPEECLHEILSRLSLEQRWLGPMFVSKTWMKACQDPSVNSVFDLEPSFKQIHIESPLRNSWWNPEFEEKVDSILRKVVDWSEGGLKKIHIRHCTDRSISYVAERCHTLEVLSIWDCNRVTHESMMKIASNCTKLRELDIRFWYQTISDEFFRVVGMNFPDLEIMRRNRYCFDGTDVYSEARAIVRLMPKLKHLQLRYNTFNAQEIAFLRQMCEPQSSLGLDT